MPDKTIHEGRNIKRIREMPGIKQEALAFELGDDWNQKKTSLLEAKETIDPTVLDEVAKVLKVPVDAIKNFDDEAAVTYFNTFFRRCWCSSPTALFFALVGVLQQQLCSKILIRALKSKKRNWCKETGVTGFFY